MLIRNIFKNLKTEKNKIMIWGIRSFITKLKAKIDVIPRSWFNKIKYLKMLVACVIFGIFATLEKCAMRLIT